MTPRDVESAAVELWLAREEKVRNPVAWRAWARRQVQEQFGGEIARLVDSYPTAPPGVLASYALYRQGGHSLVYYRQRVTA